jgi:hypothetical protein
MTMRDQFANMMNRTSSMGNSMVNHGEGNVKGEKKKSTLWNPFGGKQEGRE